MNRKKNFGFVVFTCTALLFGWFIAIEEYNNQSSIANTAIAQEPAPPQPAIPTISIPKELAGNVGQFLEIPATTNGSVVKWAVLYPSTGLNLFPMDLLKDSKTAVAVANANGIYYLHAWTALNNVPSDLATCKITIGPPIPVPPGPNPPGPQPNPPGPTPGPVTTTKLSVLFVDENSNYGTASYKPYESIVNSTALRTWLAAHCTSTDNIPDWRKWDQNTDISNESNPVWKSLMNAAVGKNLPWLVIADDKGNIVSSTAVPNNLADTTALLQKFGGK